MAMNKQELRERISKLPLFDKKEVNVTYEGKQFTQRHFAVCEVNGTEAFAYVNKGYKVLQFNELFTPVLDGIEEDVTGYLSYYGGYAVLKVFPNNPALTEGETKFGLMAINSVDMSSSIIVKFCVRHSDLEFTIPAKIVGLKKQHRGNITQVTKDYISMIGKARDAWQIIMTKFPKQKVSLDPIEGSSDIALKDVMKQLGVGKRLHKNLREEMVLHSERSYTLWDVFNWMMENMYKRKYKSDVHRQKKHDRICNAIFMYASALAI